MRRVVPAVLAVALWASACDEAKGKAAPRWPSSVVSLARDLPVQDGGRVKPLQTFARYSLLEVNHRQTVKDPAEESLSAVEWLLDCWFRPDVARNLECFSVDDSSVLDALGVSIPGKKKRDRYSYDALFAKGSSEGGPTPRETLTALAGQYRGVDAKVRSNVETQIVELHGAVVTFERMLKMFEFSRRSLDVSGSPELSAVFDGAKSVSVARVIQASEAVSRLAGAEGDAPGKKDAPPSPAAIAARNLMAQVQRLADWAATLATVPPMGTKDARPEWWTLGDLLYGAAQGERFPNDYATMLAAAYEMGEVGEDPSRIEAPMRKFHDAVVGLAKGRGEYEKIPLEVFFANADPFTWAIWAYVFAFVLLAVGWAWPNPWLRRGAVALFGAGLLLHVGGIVLRCVLRERPPISNLYETILFISGVGALLAGGAELLTKKGIALALGPVVGALGLFVAYRYEAMKAEDTMPQLEAVLDTNFWLALHVTCINLGYLGGLVASMAAHVHVLGRTFGLLPDRDDFYRSTHRITYGTLCFGLFFAVVGTILGGVWANDSWGRFWGWDPKENGALMICLAQLAILHGRLGGYLRPFGFAMATVAGGVVILFSWFHVNLLGIGLHSYGFTQGIFSGLMIAYGTELLVLTAGFVTLALGRAYGPSLPGKRVAT
jgi:ABC-type transport system involved in cytochrome c biogenesis permease subunit